MKHNPQNIHDHIIGSDLQQQQQQHEGGEHSFQVCQGIVGKLTVLLSRQQELRARLTPEVNVLSHRFGERQAQLGDLQAVGGGRE